MSDFVRATRATTPRVSAVSVALAAATVFALLLAGCSAAQPASAPSASAIPISAPSAPAIPRSAPSASATPTSTFRVTGYAEAGDTTPRQLAASSGALTMVGVDGVNLTANGDGISPVSASALSLLHESHRLGTSAELLVGNFSAELGDFDDTLAEKMFASPDHLASVVSAVASEVTSSRWDGVTVDLEGLNGWGAAAHTRDDNVGLVSFVRALKAAMGAASVSIAVTATPAGYADLGYDLAGIGRYADHIVLMAYDQHGPTWSAPGPVGGTPWVTASLKSLMRGVPKSKIQLGIAGYGYDWPGDATDGTQFSDAAARVFVARHHGTPRWDATQQEWHSSLADGTRIWWSDARTYRARFALAKSLHLGGVAVWSLGASDPLG